VAVNPAHTHVSLYLLHPSTTLATAGVKAVAAGYKDEITTVVQGDVEVRALLGYHPGAIPDWAAYVAPWLTVPNSAFGGQSAGLLLFLKVKRRIFAVPFGMAHFVIDRKLIERDFGYRAALRLLNAANLRAVDVRNLDLKTRQTRSTLTFNGGLADFALSLDSEQVMRIAGAAQPFFSDRRIIGADSFAFQHKESIQRLPDRCRTVLKAAFSTPLPKDFEALANFQPERNSKIVADLDGFVSQWLTAGALENLSIALPEIDIKTAAKFCLKTGRTKSDTFDDLTPAAAANAWIQIGATDINDPYLWAFDDNGKPVGHRYTLKECLIAQVDAYKADPTAKRVLSLDNWYRISTSFIQLVSDEVGRIPLISVATRPDFLPATSQGTSETTYNQFDVPMARPDYAEFDQKIFQAGLGVSKVEVCDFLTPGMELVCIKDYSASATLSHLFAQGSVSARMFANSAEYRQHVANVANLKFPVNIAAPLEDFTIVYAIMDDAQRVLPDDLPFFSKVNLLTHARVIRGTQMKLALWHTHKVK